MGLQFPTRAKQPGSQPHASGLVPGQEFMYHDAVINRLFGRVIDEFAEFQYYAWDDERKEVVGVGNAIPAAWDGEIASLPDGGVDAVVEARFAEGAPDADRPLRAADPDHSRLPRPGSQQPHDPADGRDRPGARPRHPDRSGTAEPEASLSARPVGALHRVAPRRRRARQTRGYERTKDSEPRSPRSPRSRCVCRGRSPTGRSGRRWRSPRAAPTSSRVLSCPSRSIENRTKGSTLSRTSGWCTRFTSRRIRREGRAEGLKPAPRPKTSAAR